MTDPRLAEATALVKELGLAATPAERIALAEEVASEPLTFESIGAYTVAMVLCTLRLCEDDLEAQRMELHALTRLAEAHDLDDALLRLTTLSRPTEDPVQDRVLQLLIGPTPGDQLGSAP